MCKWNIAFSHSSAIWKASIVCHDWQHCQLCYCDSIMTVTIALTDCHHDHTLLSAEASCRRSTSQLTNCSTLPSSTWRKQSLRCSSDTYILKKSPPRPLLIYWPLVMLGGPQSLITTLRGTGPAVVTLRRSVYFWSWVLSPPRLGRVAGRLPDFTERISLWHCLDMKLCYVIWIDLLHSNFSGIVKRFRVVVVQRHSNLPIFLLWGWVADASNQVSLGSRCCGTHIAETTGWICIVRSSTEFSKPAVVQHHGLMTLTLDFQGQMLEKPYHRNGMGCKRTVAPTGNCPAQLPNTGNSNRRTSNRLQKDNDLLPLSRQNISATVSRFGGKSSHMPVF